MHTFELCLQECNKDSYTPFTKNCILGTNA